MLQLRHHVKRRRLLSHRLANWLGCSPLLQARHTGVICILNLHDLAHQERFSVRPDWPPFCSGSSVASGGRRPLRCGLAAALSHSQLAQATRSIADSA